MDLDCNDHLNKIAHLFCEDDMDTDKIKKSVTKILEAIGEDPGREGLVDTPNRVSRSYEELLSGYRTDPRKLLNNALFNVTYDEMVIVRDIEFYSMCEHHMLPFIGRTHIAYIPEKKVIGLSKIPRIVDMFSRRLHVQERMTLQIATFLNEILQPSGVGIVVEAIHLCSKMRGVKKQQSSMTTSAMLGVFKVDLSTRMEFLNNISRGSDRLSI
ncbi:MAG: GTP cyclohydrolase I FolE [Anaerolineaceae bacterium]|nr:GTP cyclohydrolase I FolE [Anaerolineaceae bacterium]